MKNENPTLLPHNADAYRAVTEAFRLGDRAAVVHATGTGKSYIIERVAKDYGRVAVIAPNNYVLSQLKEHDIRADFLTYPTVHAMRSYPEDRYDLIVLDEFHRAGAECWGRGVDCLLMANPGAKVLGTTATEIRYLDNARNMADELFEGNVVSRLPLTEAWLRGILPVPKYVVGLFNYEDVYSEFIGRLERNRRLEERDRREAREILSRGRLRWEASHGMVSILKKHLPGDTRRIIVFCDRTENLPEVQEKFIQWLAMAGFRAAAYTVHYRNPDSMAEMEDFQKDDENESGVKVLFAIDMLNEGIHVPGVEAVVMLRSTSSKLILLQQMGRCMNAGQKRSPVIFDMGNGLMLDMSEYGLSEPNIPASLATGIDVMLFSGDKLLGGPQAGIIVGKKKYIKAMKKHPLARAMRVDKMTFAALEATLMKYRDPKVALRDIPVLNMIAASGEEMRARAERLADAIKRVNPALSLELVPVEDQIGGGSAPMVRLPGWAVSVKDGMKSADRTERKLRKAEVPVVARINEDRLLLCVRTIAEDELETVAEALRK